MFVIPTHVGFTHRVVAMLVACAMMLLSVGAYTAQAANLIDVSDTLTDSGPSALSGHLFSFEVPTGSTVGAGDDVVITFPSGFTGVNTATSGNLTVSINGGAPVAIGNFAAGAQTLTFDNVGSSAGDVITVQLASGVVTNPGSIGSYEFLITTQNGDTGRTRVAIVDYVTVTAIVNTSFDFTVSGLATSTSVNGTSTTGSTTATEIPFGVLAAGSVYTMAQELTVSTNAINGFVVTVEQDGNLRSSTGADIDGFIDGAYDNTPQAWQSPSNSLLNENTWGHWGLTTDDSDLGGTFETTNSGEFANGGSGDRWVAASTTPRQVFSHNGPADGTSQDYGLAKVGYQVEITALQEAADDYQTTLMYIATPTF
jgi:hypothetical protein